MMFLDKKENLKIIIWKDKENKIFLLVVFIMTFKNNKMEGHDVFVSPNGYKYFGGFKNYLKEGHDEYFFYFFIICKNMMVNLKW